MLRLPNGTHLEGDAEKVFTAFDDEDAAGDGVYPADLAEATGLPEERVRVLLDELVGQDVLATTRFSDDVYGVRYRRAQGA